MQSFEVRQDNIETSETLKKQRLFSDETYTKLLNMQQLIFNETGYRVTLRKLLDKLINDQSINEVTNTFISKLAF